MLLDGHSFLFSKSVEIFCIDLLLGADNALVIALACRALPERYLKGAVALGVAGAIVLRLVIGTIAGALLDIPGLRLVAAVILVLIALGLTADRGVPEARGVDASSATRPAAAGNLVTSALLIVLADAVMSFDNVLALASIARGDVVVLGIGLALSLPVLGYGGLVLTRVLRTHAWLISLGGAVLGWIAGDLAVGDAALASWVAREAPALPFVVPALSAIFVLVEARILMRRLPDAPAPQVLVATVPARRRAPRPSKPPVRPIRPVSAMVAHPAAVVAPAVADEARPQAAERMMMVGFAALFAVFGLFLVVALTLGGGLTG